MKHGEKFDQYDKIYNIKHTVLEYHKTSIIDKHQKVLTLNLNNPMQLKFALSCFSEINIRCLLVHMVNDNNKNMICKPYNTI